VVLGDNCSWAGHEDLFELGAVVRATVQYCSAMRHFYSVFCPHHTDTLAVCVVRSFSRIRTVYHAGDRMDLSRWCEISERILVIFTSDRLGRSLHSVEYTLVIRRFYP
jgi:hypothetical protein